MFKNHGFPCFVMIGNFAHHNRKCIWESHDFKSVITHDVDFEILKEYCRLAKLLIV